MSISRPIYIGGDLPEPGKIPFTEDAKPWSRRKRLEPLSTYSGRVVYDKRRKNKITLKDLARMSRRFEVDPGQKTIDAIVNEIMRYLVEIIAEIVIGKVIQLAMSWTPVGALSGALMNIISLFLQRVPANRREIEENLLPLLQQVATVTNYEIKRRP